MILESDSDIEVVKIIGTRDYSRFQHINENRNIVQKHVVNLEEGVRRINMLSVNPIIVDEQLRILDGQHRLEVATKLRLPIYYVIYKNEYRAAILYVLQKTKSWTLRDFINFYIKTESTKGYHRFEEDRVRYRTDLETLSHVYALYDTENTRGGFFATKRYIREGQFSFDDIDLDGMYKSLGAYMKFKDFCEERKIRPQVIYKCRSAVVGFCAFFSFYKLNMDRFYSKLTDRWHTMKPTTNFRDFVRQLLSIYNYKCGSFANSFSYDKFEAQCARTNFIRVGKKRSKMKQQELIDLNTDKLKEVY